LLKLQERIGGETIKENSNSEQVVIKEDTRENFVEQKEPAKLNAQQLAEATQFLASFENKPLGELIQVEGALQMAAMRVEGDEKAVLDYILAKLNVLIAEFEN
ncbi:MAG: hypothetical protein P8N28_02460, partial [Phycisphaerales bacterium]|nr:hypothetical protein [Phycisphaerales bacterium]